MVARYVHSLTLLSALPRSLCSVAPFMGLLTQFAHSLVEQLNLCVHAKNAIASVVLTRNTPSVEQSANLITMKDDLRAAE